MSSWKQFKERVIAAAQRFMQGRYGAGQLGLALIWVSFVLVLLGGRLLYGIPSLLGTAGWIWSVWRLCSRNIEKRNRENRRFLTFKARLTDRRSRYYRCPNCKQTVRVPRGRGKICIKCPKCGEKFVRKS